MKKLNLLLLAFGGTALLLCFPPSSLEAQNLLNTPQKIVIDRKPGRVGFTRNRLLVSNYDTGSIVEIDTLGMQSYFIQGAGFVDGLEIVGNNIYGIGNNRKILAYNLDTKQQVMNLTIEGNPADYLSSITYDSIGHLFISCPNLNAIYKLRLSDYSYWIFARDNGLNKPNGILLEMENDRIVVIDDSPGSSLIHAISLSDSTVTTLASTPFDRPDGITRDKFGNYYIGGYYLPGLYTTDADFSYSPQMFFSGSNMVYPTYDPLDHSLLVTYYNSNSWERIPLTTTSLGETIIPNGFNIGNPYPNPANGKFEIPLNLTGKAKIKIHDSLGRILREERIEPGVFHKSFDLSSEGKGLYLISIQSGSEIQTMKIMVN